MRYSYRVQPRNTDKRSFKNDPFFEEKSESWRSTERRLVDVWGTCAPTHACDMMEETEREQMGKPKNFQTKEILALGKIFGKDTHMEVRKMSLYLNIRGKHARLECTFNVGHAHRNPHNRYRMGT